MQVRRFLLSLLIVLVSFRRATPHRQPERNPRPPNRSKSTAAAQKNAQAKRKLGHIKRAFVASADLRPMAQQLLENRTPQAYQGVEAYARKHRERRCRAAGLAGGRLRALSRQRFRKRTVVHGTARKPLEPLLGDYLAYLQAVTYQGENNHAAVLEDAGWL